jgi:hypothetical protein
MTITVRQIRKILFDTDKYTVLGSDERTNEESRNILYGMSNQDEILNVIDKGTYLLIYNQTRGNHKNAPL